MSYITGLLRAAGQEMRRRWHDTLRRNPLPFLPVLAPVGGALVLAPRPAITSFSTCRSSRRNHSAIVETSNETDRFQAPNTAIVTESNHGLNRYARRNENFVLVVRAAGLTPVPSVSRSHNRPQDGEPLASDSSPENTPNRLIPRGPAAARNFHPSLSA